MREVQRINRRENPIAFLIAISLSTNKDLRFYPPAETWLLKTFATLHPFFLSHFNFFLAWPFLLKCRPVVTSWTVSMGDQCMKLSRIFVGQKQTGPSNVPTGMVCTYERYGNGSCSLARFPHCLKGIESPCRFSFLMWNVN